jgi:hypothetical protein
MRQRDVAYEVIYLPEHAPVRVKFGIAAIDFYDEDFPWRYSPVSPDAASHRLPPWIVLVVLKAEEFTRSDAGGQPRASFTLTAAAHRPDIFPAIDQEWAWAHVHVNAALGGANSVPDLAALGATLAANQDIAYSRLLSPRKLDPNCGYTAFLVPAFEVGRRAGLGETIADTDDGTVRSWQGAADEFPIYFEWRFRTGVDGDFESLVRALVPRDMDPRVGIRDLDIARPGFGVATATNPPDNLVGLERCWRRRRFARVSSQAATLPRKSRLCSMRPRHCATRAPPIPWWRRRSTAAGTRKSIRSVPHPAPAAGSTRSISIRAIAPPPASARA